MSQELAIGIFAGAATLYLGGVVIATIALLEHPDVQWSFYTDGHTVTWGRIARMALAWPKTLYKLIKEAS